jgi:hypothetical protein
MAGAVNARVWSPILLAVCLAGCVRMPPPARLPVRSIAVFPPNNRTGDPLLIAGASFLEKYVLPTEHYTVADALAANARLRLEDNGFAVVAPQTVAAAANGQTPASAADAAALARRSGIAAAVLYIEIRRWEPNVGTEPTFIIASVGATLIDPANGHVLWTGEHPSRPVQTPGIVNLGDAYAVAARTLTAQLLAPLAPAADPGKPPA